MSSDKLFYCMKVENGLQEEKAGVNADFSLEFISNVIEAFT